MEEGINRIYAKGDRPSGSSDPYALRRAGNGIVQIPMDGIQSYSAWNLEHLLNGGITKFGDVFAKATPPSSIFPTLKQGFDRCFKVFKRHLL